MEPDKKKPGRPRGKTVTEKPGPTLKLSGAADNQLTAHAKKLKLTKREYASAAIGYFAATGLDPTKEQPKGLASVGIKVDEVERNVRTQNHEIGTRLIQIIRTWEKNSYAFMQQQQASLTNYLELIESNILQHQVLVETNYFAPMVENLYKVNLEAFITRGLTSQLLVKVGALPEGNYQKQMDVSDAGRDQQLVMLMREFLKTNSVPLPKPTRRPAVTPVPAAPPKPAATDAAAPVAPDKS